MEAQINMNSTRHNFRTPWKDRPLELWMENVAAVKIENTLLLCPMCLSVVHIFWWSPLCLLCKWPHNLPIRILWLLPLQFASLCLFLLSFCYDYTSREQITQFKNVHKVNEIYQEEKKNLWPNNISKNVQCLRPTGKCKWKNALRFHLNPVRVFKIKTTNGDKYRIDVRKMKNLISAVVNANCCRYCGNHFRFPKNLKIDRHSTQSNYTTHRCITQEFYIQL